MAFLDNSGDIILDAVLTKAGAERLARADGSFRIAKFALADDEIDYGLYDKEHASGSAYYALKILQTPVLEAFTNVQGASGKSKLINIPRNNVLYMPELIKFTGEGFAQHADGVYYLAADKTTVDKWTGSGESGSLGAGILNAANVGRGVSSIAMDQGINNVNAGTVDDALPIDLMETSYMIEMDNRLGYIFPPYGGRAAAAQGAAASPIRWSFLDDNNIATYYVSRKTAGGMVTPLSRGSDTDSSISKGPRGTRLAFRVGSSLDLKSGTSLTSRLGRTNTAIITNSDSGDTPIAIGKARLIDTKIRITGVTTGYRLDIPVTYVKYIL